MTLGLCTWGGTCSTKRALDKESTMEGKLDKKSARSIVRQDRRDFFSNKRPPAESEVTDTEVFVRAR